jgi:Cytochrome C'
MKGQSMKNYLALPAFLVVFIALWSAPLHAADADGRLLVEMSPEARAELRAEMLDFQAALHSIIGALAEKQFSTAADIAEKQIGLSAMGRHRNAPPNARPGMFMPNDMHAIARTMHAASSDFAKIAKSGNTSRALGSLQAVTAACVACHRSYRTQ